MNELIKSIDTLLGGIALKAVVRGGVEWYLWNNLNDYKAVLLANPSAREIENATRALLRFCTESMDWDDSLYKDCCAIAEIGNNLTRK